MKPHVKIYFDSQEEIDLVKKRAREARFGKEIHSGASPYMKELALGYKPTSLIDKKILMELAIFRADLVRLGNLVKASIFPTNEKGERVGGMKVEEAKKWLSEIRA